MLIDMRKVIADVTEGNSDVVNYEYLEGTLIKEAVMEGVVVYEYGEFLRRQAENNK